MKKILNIILLAVLFGSVLSSCSSDDNPEFSLDGEWTIYSREIKCTGTGTAASAAETLQKDLEQKFKSGMAANNYIYTFGDIVDTGASTYEYSEDIYKKDSNLPIPNLSIGGFYKKVDGGIIAYANNLAIFDNWESKFNILDLNNEHVMFSQDLTSEDLEIILYVYFGSLRELDKNITGTLVTKAVKNKKQE